MDNGLDKIFDFRGQSSIINSDLEFPLIHLRLLYSQFRFIIITNKKLLLRPVEAEFIFLLIYHYPSDIHISVFLTSYLGYFVAVLICPVQSGIPL